MSEPPDRRAFFRGLMRSAAEMAGPAAEPLPEANPQAARSARDEVVVAAADPSRLSPADVDRYSRQLVLPEWSEAAQLALREANVLVVGAGALGSPVASYLVGAGVGQLGIVDSDTVELSNLHRQTLHYTADFGAPKAHSAALKLGLLNPDVLVEPYQARFNPLMLEGVDLVVDCADSFATRYEVNAACCAARIPLVEGGVVGLTGLVMAIRPGVTACYRCAFPDAPANAPGCAEAGVLGPAAGVIGSLQALEALKLLSGVEEPLLDAFLQVDLHDHTFLRVATSRRADCPDCGGL
jgi:molybdopterin/thiamine biosynthesis adenylyltransferase